MLRCVLVSLRTSRKISGGIGPKSNIGTLFGHILSLPDSKTGLKIALQPHSTSDGGVCYDVSAEMSQSAR